MTTLLDSIRTALSAKLDAQLVRELLEAYTQAKQNYYSGGHRLSAVEGGRFCEAAFRILELVAFGSATPLGTQIDSEGLIKRLALTAAGSKPDSIRLHIPRSLRLVYDIRNKRDTAHLADGIDPNIQDATLVASALDWVLAEFVRLYYGATANEAQRAVEAIVRRRAPAVQEIQGNPKVLRAGLSASDFVLLLLYDRGTLGATMPDLTRWCRPTMRKNLRRTLENLTHEKAYVHAHSDSFWITHTGIQYVEASHLLDVPEPATRSSKRS